MVRLTKRKVQNGLQTHEQSFYLYGSKTIRPLLGEMYMAKVKMPHKRHIGKERVKNKMSFLTLIFVLTVFTIYIEVTLDMLVQEIKNVILSRCPSLRRSIYKQHIHQLIATKIHLNIQ
jgi:hypothetical protein